MKFLWIFENLPHEVYVGKKENVGPGVWWLNQIGCSY